MRKHNSLKLHKALLVIKLAIAQLLLTSCTTEVENTPSVVDTNAQHPQGCVQRNSTDNTKGRRHLVESYLRGPIAFEGESLKRFSIAERMKFYQVPAVSLAVIKQGALDWSQAYGVKSHESQQAVDCDTLFQAASLSKPVTLMAAMRMQQAGKIDLDKDINQYLTSYQLPAGKQTLDNPVTFRNILDHTSGITSGGYRGYKEEEGFPTDIEVLTKKGVTNSKLVEVVNLPGEKLAYSGGGYTVAEVAMQDIMQQSFKQLMDLWILNPIKMKNADFSQPLPQAKHKQVARGHRSDGSMVKGGWHSYPEQAAAGLWATATDMALFMIEIHKGYKGYKGQSSIFSQAMVTELLSQPREQHVYGFIISGTGDSLMLSHYGGNAGYSTGMHIYLESGDGISYLASSDYNGNSLNSEIRFAVSDTYNWPNFKLQTVKRRNTSAEKLQQLAGQYKFKSWKIDIEYSKPDNQIIIVFPNNDRYQMTPIVGDKQAFIHAITGTKASFSVDKNKQNIVLYGQTGIRE